MSIETNCFRITGLDALEAEYRLYRIAGLRRDGADYYGNLQRLVRQLSFQMKAPVTTHTVDGDPFLFVPCGFGDPPVHVMLVGVVVGLKDTGRVVHLDFKTVGPELDAVRLRFLQFIFQDPLWQNPQLWQPGAGKPFFFKKPARQLGKIDLCEGFTIRVTRHPEGGFGLIVDLRRKLVSRSSLPASVTREGINALKGRSCVYKMGHRWFEVTLAGLADLSVGEPSIQLEGKSVSLIGYLHAKSSKPVPASIANLSPEGAAIYYRTNGPAQRSAPAALCHLVEDTHGQEGARHQRETTIDPQERRRQIHRLVGLFLEEVPVGDFALSVSQRAETTTTDFFGVPALRFGNDRRLSIDTKEQDMGSAVHDYGRRRRLLLKDKKAGFYEQSSLDRQYVVLPRSVADSYGAAFLKDLKAQIDDLYPNSPTYEPEVIPYDDLNARRDFVGQARAIEAAVRSADIRPGYALVMVHRYERRPRSADQLAAWAVKEFPLRFDLNASVIHTDMAKKAYGVMPHRNGTCYGVKAAERGRFSGYLLNVALNKILLTNGKWPFILDTPLYADVVIGIDVKNNTAAFTLIADGGKIVRLSTSPSRQKEQLLSGQVANFIHDLIRRERSYFSGNPRQIVVHRDGRLWPTELDGIKAACKRLAKDGYLEGDGDFTAVEISKSAPAPLRLFHVEAPTRGRVCVKNPMVGTWLQTAPHEGYVCTTGSPFQIPGTANPLHIKRVAGGMSVERCLSDVYSLTCLTWTRPESAMRLPISIKLCDRSLFDEAAEYDQDAIEFETHGESEEGTI